MISDDVLNRIRHGVCAVGYLTVPLSEFVKDPTRSQHFKILGTGFLIRETTVMTNRHVLKLLYEAQSNESIPDEQRLIQFVFPRKGGWRTDFRELIYAGYIANPDVDVAFLELDQPPKDESGQCGPLQLSDDASKIKVAKPVGMFGYPQGTTLLVNSFIDKEQIYRFGPVLQQGYISAVAPYEGNQPISRILCDIRTVGGMSGSPVFYSDTGEVFAIHEASNQVTTAFSIPIYREEVMKWLELHDEKMSKKLSS